MENDNRVVRLPLYDPETGDDLPGYLEIDVKFFLSSTRGLRSTQARLVELEDHEDSGPTDEEACDMVDRIISGLPPRVLKPANPEGIATYPMGKLYDTPQRVTLIDVPSAYPKLEWFRIPEFDNYEINQLGEIRNRFTRRILETTREGNGRKYVEMHDKDGFPHYVSVDNQIKVVFGE